ncbi:MAG: PAS domain-containing protein [Alphaproteobacteria bacterium]|nr:PAS domain-containing protein [Alphaproteobacteria bacterium]MBU1526419.1 PAS domain-containing protein [Alphaproteobacteria bacterium]MBU2352260.1 PAS domain-containing protein [Alphaproteobacteria bacterium]MBU2383632.1 PAS domain-containing protein [Alphaproteobacteria bacterium]
MVMEGQIDWTLVFALLAVLGFALAIAAWAWAVTRRTRTEATGSALDAANRRAEAAETRTLEILNAIPVALVETDKQGKFVFANRAAHQLLGRRDAELLGLRFHSATWGITYPDGRPVPPDLLPSARALRGQTVKGFQHLLANPATRRKMLVSVTAMPIETATGEIIGSTAAIVETEGLTQPVEPDAPLAPELSPADALVRRVFDSASSALVILDPDGRVTEANPVARALSGRDDLILGGDFADLFLGEDERVEARQALRAALTAPAGAADPLDVRGGAAAGTRWNLLPLRAEDGTVEALLAAGERAGPETEPAPEAEAVTAPVEDLLPELEALRARAEAAEAEAERARAEARAELEAARRLEGVGRLTGGVSQDFHALLGVMTSALDMMISQAEEPDRVRRLGRAALAAGQRGETLTRRLAAFADGDDAAPVQMIDLGAVLRGMEGKLRLVAGPTVDLMVEVPSDPMVARVDPVALEGALAALVTNAAQATAGRGSVAVRLSQVDDATLNLTVRDDGPGMDGDVARRAVEPFFTTREGAAGLGLAHAHAFARQSGGSLSIESAPGAGTGVTLALPAAA